MDLSAADFDRIVAEHQRMVFSIALRSLRNRALAEEITQEVFLALHQHGGAIESGEHLVYWLRRVTARRCIDQVRRQRLRRFLLLDFDAPAPELRLADPFVCDRLQRLVASLPAVRRLALVLRYQQDMEPAEIAGVLDISAAEVKRHLRKALAHLRARLNQPSPLRPRVVAPANVAWSGPEASECASPSVDTRPQRRGPRAGASPVGVERRDLHAVRGSGARWRKDGRAAECEER